MTEHPTLFKGDMVRANMNCKPNAWPAETIDPSLPFKWQTRRIMKNQPTEVTLDPDYSVDGEQPSRWFRFDPKTSAKLEYARPRCRRGPKPTPAALRRAQEWQSREVDGPQWSAPEVIGLCPYGLAGDGIWSRETWAVGRCADAYPPRCLDPKTWLQDNGGCWYRADHREPPTPISPRGKWRPSIFLPRWACREVPEVKRIRVERVQDISEEDVVAEGCALQQWAGDVHQKWPRTAGFAEIWDGINLKRGFGWLQNPWCWVVDYMRTVQT